MLYSKEPKKDMYPAPPDDRLHYALVQVSLYKYVVVEYTGRVILPGTDTFPPQEVGTGPKPQHVYEYRVVSKGMKYVTALSHMRNLIADRFPENQPIMLGPNQ